MKIFKLIKKCFTKKSRIYTFKVLFIFFLLNINIIIFYFIEFHQLIVFEKAIEKKFKENNHVNLNKIESEIIFGIQNSFWISKFFFRRKVEKFINYSNEINIGLSLDKDYILKAMITTASIIYSQKSTTKLRLHFSVVLDFKSKDMIKIYSLRNRMRNDVEFNFYNASRVEKELNSISNKGPGLAAKLLLPQLVDDNVERLIILDCGDLLVLRDLSEMYNWNMNNNMYMGSPDPSAGVFGKISNKTLNIYINAGNYLIDVKKVKNKNMYNLFLKYKDVYGPPFAEQMMINDIASGEVGYMPLEFGIVPAFSNDAFYFNQTEKSIYTYYNLSIISEKSNFLPKNFEEFYQSVYNPVIVHSWYGKWSQGNGMNIYRKLCQFFIELSGIKDEICKKFPGYCIKV